MTVRELINSLSEMKQDAEVTIIKKQQFSSDVEYSSKRVFDDRDTVVIECGYQL